VREAIGHWPKRAVPVPLLTPPAGEPVVPTTDDLPLPTPATAAIADDLQKAYYQARLQVTLDERKTRLADTLSQAQADRAADVDREKTVHTNDYALSQALYGAYIDVAKGMLDRAHDKANFVQKAAAAIGTVYTGILGLSYAGSSGAIPAPAGAIIPAFFLAVALVGSTVYLSFMSEGAPGRPENMTGVLVEDQQRYRDAFIEWIRRAVRARAGWLHAAIVSLGVAVCLLPLPYVPMDIHKDWWILGFLLLLGLVTTGVVSALTRPT